MLYEGSIYRPPSEADAFILQATIGCSWNACTYCDMYREKRFRVRPLAETLAIVEAVGCAHRDVVRKVFVADGDALVMETGHFVAILDSLASSFPRLRRVSCYATAMNILEKPPEDLARLRERGLSLLYIGPESGDDPTLKRIAKGAGFAEHVDAATRAHEAGFDLSAIFLLGAGGIARSAEHATASARLASEMDPKFLSILTLTVIPGTPIAKLEADGRFALPPVEALLEELRTFIADAKPTDAVFRTNHASNYLPLSGRLPRDRDRLLQLLDAARDGEVALRPEGMRGL